MAKRPSPLSANRTLIIGGVHLLPSILKSAKNVDNDRHWSGTTNRSTIPPTIPSITLSIVEISGCSSVVPRATYSRVIHMVSLIRTRIPCGVPHSRVMPPNGRSIYCDILQSSYPIMTGTTARADRRGDRTGRLRPVPSIFDVARLRIIP